MNATTTQTTGEHVSPLDLTRGDRVWWSNGPGIAMQSGPVARINRTTVLVGTEDHNGYVDGYVVIRFEDLRLVQTA